MMDKGGWGMESERRFILEEERDNIMGKDFLKKLQPSSELVYNTSIDVSRITNVLLIDRAVKGYQKIVDSVNSNTFYIVYSVMSKKSDLVAFLVS